MSAPKARKRKTGYKSPPVASQWPAGTSGNDRGRPRKPRTAGEILDVEFSRQMTVTINGKTKKVSAFQALIMSLNQKAIGGDVKASAELRRWSESYDFVPDFAAPDLRTALANRRFDDEGRERIRLQMMDILTLVEPLSRCGLVREEKDGRLKIFRSALERLFDDSHDEKTRQRVFKACGELLID